MSALEHEQQLPFGELAATIAHLAMAVDDLREAVGQGGARLPYRNSAVSSVPAPARNGACAVTWLHAANELGVADAYLHLFDEYQADAVIVGSTTPKQTFWLPAGMGLDDPWIPPIEFDRGIVVAATNSRDGAGAPDHALLVNIATIPRKVG